jgi:hypothetical protein
MAERETAHDRRPWPAVAVGTAVVLALLAFYQVVSQEAPMFALAALLYAAGAMLLAHRRSLGLGLMAVPSLFLLVAQGLVLLDRGVLPGAYDAPADFVVAVAATPLAALNLVAATLLVATR